jgi:hypothetical protein
MAETLADALPKVMAEVRDVVLPAYEDVLPYAPMTGLTIAVIKAELDAATKAIVEGDVVQMMALYQSLKETCDSL